MRSSIPFCLCVVSTIAQAQVEPQDTLRGIDLPDAQVMGTRPDMSRLAPVQGTYLFAGRKSEVIALSERDAAVTEKYGRQLFAKVPGVFVYDMDGTGNQLNISTRGLDPHRGWEFNIRKDGIVTNSDMYGYPASHYNVPMEAIERIELVRGTASLQYGAQFGGMLNFVSKQADTTRRFAFENISTVGSFGLLSTFNRASGKLGKWTYNAWMQRKGLDGYRDNARSDFQAQNVTIGFTPNRRLRFRAEWTRSDYVVQLPGPLNDSMFHADPRMSIRARNYYQPDIHVPSFVVEWEPNERTAVRWATSAVLGRRNSVLFDRTSNIVDALDTNTLNYAVRQVDIDQFNSYTSELRVRRHYILFKRTSTWAGGVQYMHNDLHRRQQGKGTTGTDYDLTLSTSGFGRDLHFRTTNLAAFLENRWALTDRLSVTTRARMEMGGSDFTGDITYYSDEALPNSIDHNFPLFAVSAEHTLGKRANVYAGWSQAYRPVILKDIIPATVYEVSDKDLKDAYGDNLEMGVRGNTRWFKWDVSAFQVQYNDRLGTLAEQDSNGVVIIRRTNIGNSVTRGVECFLQADVRATANWGFSVFTSTSYMDGRYRDARIRSGNNNVDISGNRIESVPEWISRNGATFRYGGWRLSVLYSYVSESYADALNTEQPNATGTVGIVPAYGILDVNTTLHVNDNVELRANLNNLLDEQYFTKRPQFYPGPGIWPSDGRNFSFTVTLRI